MIAAAFTLTCYITAAFVLFRGLNQYIILSGFTHSFNICLLRLSWEVEPSSLLAKGNMK